MAVANDLTRQTPGALVIRLGSAKKLRLVRPGRFVGIVLLVFMVVIAAGFVRRQLRIIGLRQEIERTKAEIRAMEIRNDELRKQIAYLNSPEYIEQSARNNLGLVMPGELVYNVAEVKEFAAPFSVPKRKTTSSQSGY